MNVRDDQKLQVKEATDLVGLIGQDLALKKKGREFVALCPFHDDSNPSLTVVPTKQIYHCFVCKAGGDAFSWMMNYHKMDFRQALEHLAERAGLQLEPPRSAGRLIGPDGQPVADDEPAGQRSSQRKGLLEANPLAAGFFRSMLSRPEQGAVARRYVEQRGISSEMAEQFQIGCAPDSWDELASKIQQSGWDTQTFLAAGLISPRPRGEGYYDKLRHRLIFPICDALGRPIAFGGRTLRDEDQPKYLNSPETAAFNKSATLFGLHLAKQAIIKTGVALIVEGYTDVIACHQHGLDNVVATLGTALTTEHVAALRHYAEKVVLLFDADEAGLKAADHAVEVFLTGSLDVSIGVLPDGLDPADLLQEPNGRQRWDESIEKATDALDWQFDRIRQRFDDAKTLTGRETIATDYLRTIAQLGISRTSPIRRAQVVQRLANLLHMPEREVDELLKQQQRQVRPVRPTPVVVEAQTSDPGDGGKPQQQLAYETVTPAMRQAEQDLIGCLVHRPDGLDMTLGDGRSIAEAIGAAQFSVDDYRELYQMFRDRLAEDGDVSIGELTTRCATRQELVKAVVEAYGHVETMAGSVDERLERLLIDSAEALIRNQENRASERALQQMTATAHSDDEDLMRQYVEHCRKSDATRIYGGK